MPDLKKFLRGKPIFQIAWPKRDLFSVIACFYPLQKGIETFFSLRFIDSGRNVNFVFSVEDFFLLQEEIEHVWKKKSHSLLFRLIVEAFDSYFVQKLSDLDFEPETEISLERLGREKALLSFHSNAAEPAQILFSDFDLFYLFFKRAWTAFVDSVPFFFLEDSVFVSRKGAYFSLTRGEEEFLFEAETLISLRNDLKAMSEESEDFEIEASSIRVRVEGLERATVFFSDFEIIDIELKKLEALLAYCTERSLEVLPGAYSTFLFDEKRRWLQTQKQKLLQKIRPDVKEK